MTHRYILEALDRTFRDILRKDLPFGGKIIVLAGDFRQISPVVKHASRSQIVVDASKSSKLWENFKIFRLTENLRVRLGGYDVQCEEYAEWLIKHGNGMLRNLNSTIEIPKPLCIDPSELI